MPWTAEELEELEPPVLANRGDWKLTASHGAEKLGGCVDGDKGSRYDTGGAQVPGMWVQVEFPEVSRINRIVLDSAGSSRDYPRGYEVTCFGGWEDVVGAGGEGGGDASGDGHRVSECGGEVCEDHADGFGERAFLVDPRAGDLWETGAVRKGDLGGGEDFVDIEHFGSVWVSKGAMPMELSRRNLLKAGFLGATLAGLGAYAYACGAGRKGFVRRALDVPIAGLPDALDGFRIAHLTDFHIDPLIEQEHHAKAVRISNAMKPDLVALTGDFVSNAGETISELSPVLEKLEARHGVYAVLGNHDGWTNPGKVARSLDRVGIRVFENEGISLRSTGIPLFLAGVDSVWAGHAEPRRALGGLQGDETGVLLCHEPDIFRSLAGEVPFSLMLSGHTHGGQVRCPGLGAPILPRFGKLYPYGMYEEKGARLHVSAGIGTVDQHVRLFCPPEVTCLTLRRMV